MALKARLTTRLVFLRLVSVSIFSCAIVFLPASQFAGLTWVESSQTELPSQEDGGNSEEELAVFSSVQRKVYDRRRARHVRPARDDDRLRQITSASRHLPATDGHRLANGLCAPLLI